MVSCWHGHSRRPPVDCRRIPQGRRSGPARVGCDCVQLFTKNTNQWRAKPITAEEARRFRTALADSGHQPPAGPRLLPDQPGQPRRAACGGSRSTPWWRNSAGGDARHPLGRRPSRGPTPAAARGRRWAASSRPSTKSTRPDPRLRRSAACWKPPPGRAPRWAGGSSTWPPSSTACKTPIGWASASTPATSSPPAIRLATAQAIARRCGIRPRRRPGADPGLPSQRQPAASCGTRVDRHAHIGRGQMGLEAFRRLLSDRRFRDGRCIWKRRKRCRGSGTPTGSICGCSGGWRKAEGGGRKAEGSRSRLSLIVSRYAEKGHNAPPYKARMTPRRIGLPARQTDGSLPNPTPALFLTRPPPG